MGSTLQILFLLFFLLACGKEREEAGSGSFNQEIVSDLVLGDPLPQGAQTFDIDVTYVNFTSEQKEKYERALEVIRKVVASEEFMGQVLSHSYGGRENFVENLGRSNAAIYQSILFGGEALSPEWNNRMDVEVELYYENSSTIGYTFPSSRRIWVNLKYFDSYTPALLAGNLFHEWLHKLGYTHAISYSLSRDYTVPYAVGRMVSSLGRKYDL